MNKTRAAHSDIALEEELSYADQLTAPHFTGEHLLEDNAWLITGETDDDDIFAVSLTFNVDGAAWGGKPATLRQTNFMAIPKSQRGQGLADNDYIGVRSDPVHSLDLKVTNDGQQVVWSVGGVDTVAEPPYWSIQGEHAGVDFDVTLGGVCDASRFLGPFSELQEAGRAGIEQPGWAEGTITANGVTHTLQKGISMHEKVIIGDQWVVGESLKRRSQHFWMWCLSDDLRIFAYVKEATGVVFGHVDAGEQHSPFGGDGINVEVLERWEDPRTGVIYPCKAAFTMTSPEATVAITVEAYGRFMYNYALADGAISYYGLACRANGTITYADGNVIPVEDMRTYMECGIFPTPLPVN